MTPSTHSARPSADARRRTRGATGAALPRRLLPALLALVTFGAACDATDRLLEVETPSRLAEDSYIVPANASLIVGSAVADYECALGAYDVVSALAAGEFTDGSQTASRWAYDRRDVLASDAHYSTFNCESIGIYTPISTARYTNDQVLSKLDADAAWAEVPNRDRLIATSAAFAGFSYILLGEGFCAAAVNVGPELTPEQLFDSAEVRFTRAITAAQAAGDQNLLNLAYVGRARARLNGGDAAGAAGDAANVPTAFVYNTTADANSPRRLNRVFAQNNASFAVTVATAYRNLNDPRVRVADGGRNTGDQVNRLWIQQKYATQTTGLPIATGIEARLIEAEARGAAQGVAIINALRARTGVALPPLTAEQQANFQATVYEERRRELFLQGNRWYDLRRGNLALVPATGTVYPKGGSYGDQRCWPVPQVEVAANPNI